MVRKNDPDDFRRVWTAFFVALVLSVSLGIASAFVRDDGVLLGVAVVTGTLLILGSLRGFANRVQRRLDRKQRSREG